MSYLYVYLACATAMGWLDAPSVTSERLATCVAVGAGAMDEGVDHRLAIALSYTVSRFNPRAVSSAGALGPLQVKPVFHCPGGRVRGCDLITAGLRAMKKYRKKYKRWPEALCHWNSGNECYPRSRRFARIVLERRRALTLSKGDKGDG